VKHDAAPSVSADSVSATRPTDIRNPAGDVAGEQSVTHRPVVVGVGGTGLAPETAHGRAIVVDRPKRRASYEDLMQVPDTTVAEIIDGELIVLAPVAS
jgi:hypothetical protein